MARASLSFQPRTKALERMKNDSQINRAHGNAAGQAHSEEKELLSFRRPEVRRGIATGIEGGPRLEKDGKWRPKWVGM